MSWIRGQSETIAILKCYICNLFFCVARVLWLVKGRYVMPFSIHPVFLDLISSLLAGFLVVAERLKDLNLEFIVIKYRIFRIKMYFPNRLLNTLVVLLNISCYCMMENRIDVFIYCLYHQCYRLH